MSARTEGRFRERPDRRGFALPFALLTLALITAAVVAAFSATSAETYANNAMRAQDRAYQLAEAGLQQFMLRRAEAGFCSNCVANPAVADSEWTRVSLTRGYANVVVVRLRRDKSDGTPALFLLRSTGVDTSVKLSGAGNAVYAQRTLGLYGTWGTAPMQVLGAFTSLNGLTNTASIPGGGVPFEGDDACGSLPDVAGATAPSGGGYGGSGERPTGSPPLDTNTTLDSLKKRVGIDWEGIINRDAIPADFTVPSGPWPTSGQMSSWPVIRVRGVGTYTIPGSGRGLLIVDSNLVISGNRTWDGVVLVGGSLTANGTGDVSGAIVTGLNKLRGAVDAGTLDNDLVSNRVQFLYNSCRVESAAHKVDRYFALTNTWMDNLAIW